MALLQPLVMDPQFFPCAAQVVGVQPHCPCTPAPPQLVGAWQGFPQSSSFPHPSEAGPH
jgi:hypothetical protein